MPAIPFIVDSATRRKLEADPQKAVLLSFGPKTPQRSQDNDDAWHRVMIATPKVRIFVQRLLYESLLWRWNDGDDADRFAFFATLLREDDRRLTDIAFSEISRASYTRIRTLSDVVPAAELSRRLLAIEEFRYAPISILLLGLSTDPAVRAEVVRRFPGAIGIEGRLLYAWALAGIEVGGKPAIDKIGQRLTLESLSEKARRDLILSLSVAGTARPELRQAIVPLLRQEALARDENLDLIARSFLQWSERSLDQHFEVKKTDPAIDFETRYLLGLATARNSGNQ